MSLSSQGPHPFLFGHIPFRPLATLTYVPSASLVSTASAFKPVQTKQVPVEPVPVVCPTYSDASPERTMALNCQVPDDAASRLTCHVCLKTFTRAFSLKSHMYLHEQTKPIPCSVCDKTFVTMRHLMNHQRVHTGERPFRCGAAGCDAAYTANSSLKRHMAVCVYRAHS
ncbi:hypothetical protein PBRA_006195 [Plasmodiophora brassicae]|uniref:C2H2-type domain-containing protein n=1 Tax=Plasmodiophora brassicae TaxID=37360 RepID=A0A0G4ISG4_PLABS|nr:hypothetical protein PBRA_006195 [Plasmodiophora brassicae]